MKKLTNTNYPIGDFLIRVKNVAMAKNKEVTMKSTKQIVAAAEALVKMGFLTEVKKGKGEITAILTYKNRMPRIMDIKLVSKPGLRVYVSADELLKKRSPSVLLVSTPKGVMSSLKAAKERVGGEVIAEIL